MTTKNLTLLHDWLARAREALNKRPSKPGGDPSVPGTEAWWNSTPCDSTFDGVTCTKNIGHEGRHVNGMRQWGLVAVRIYDPANPKPGDGR